MFLCLISQTYPSRAYLPTFGVVEKGSMYLSMSYMECLGMSIDP